MLRAEAEKEVAEARRLGHMNLTKELDKLQIRHEHQDCVAYDPLFWKKMEIWREMVRRIEALEKGGQGWRMKLAALVDKGL